MSWQKGGNAATTLRNALNVCSFNIDDCIFINLFGNKPNNPERPTRAAMRYVRRAARDGLTIVGMGKKVQRFLREADIPHKELVHPAARGKIRGKERYVAHVKEVVCDNT